MPQRNVCMMRQISGMDLNWTKAPHVLGTGWVNRQPQFMRPRISIEGAHKFVVLVGSVAMLDRLGLRGSRAIIGAVGHGRPMAASARLDTAFFMPSNLLLPCIAPHQLLCFYFSYLRQPAFEWRYVCNVYRQGSTVCLKPTTNTCLSISSTLLTRHITSKTCTTW